MNLSIKSLENSYYKKEKYIGSKVRICVACGSTIVYESEKGITCRSCGSKKKFMPGSLQELLWMQ